MRTRCTSSASGISLLAGALMLLLSTQQVLAEGEGPGPGNGGAAPQHQTIVIPAGSSLSAVRQQLRTTIQANPEFKYKIVIPNTSAGVRNALVDLFRLDDGSSFSRLSGVTYLLSIKNTAAAYRRIQTHIRRLTPSARDSKSATSAEKFLLAHYTHLLRAIEAMQPGLNGQDEKKKVIPSEPKPDLNGQGEKKDPVPDEPANASDNELRKKIGQLQSDMEKNIETATKTGAERKELDDRAMALARQAEQAELVDKDEKRAEELWAQHDSLQNESTKLQPGLTSRDWQKAIELAEEAWRLMRSNSLFGEASEMAEKLAQMYQPSLRPDIRDPESGTEYEFAAKAQENAARFYADAYDDADMNNNVERARAMLEKAIEAYREAILIWSQASTEYKKTIKTRDGKEDKKETTKEQAKAKPAEKRIGELNKVITDLNDRLQYLPE